MFLELHSIYVMRIHYFKITPWIKGKLRMGNRIFKEIFKLALKGPTYNMNQLQKETERLHIHCFYTVASTGTKS